jgi:hypothetical protein
MKYSAGSKGRGPVSARFAVGGEVITSRSRFLKVADTFRTDIQKTEHDKVGKGGTLSKLEGDSKSLAPVKPKT